MSRDTGAPVAAREQGRLDGAMVPYDSAMGAVQPSARPQQSFADCVDGAMQDVDRVMARAEQSGYSLDASAVFRDALEWRRAEQAENFAFDREMRQYQYDSQQRVVDREIRQLQHAESTTAAREDKDWVSKVRATYDAVQLAWSRSLVYSLVSVLVLDVAWRCLGIYQAWKVLSIQALMCYGMNGTTQEDGTFSFTRIDQLGDTLLRQQQTSCAKTAALRVLAIVSFYLLLSVGMMVLRHVALLGNWYPMLSLVAHIVALSSNGWLPTQMILGVLTMIVAIYTVGYVVVWYLYRKMWRKLLHRSDDDVGVGPSANVVNHQLLVLHDATCLCQLVPSLVGAFWAATLYYTQKKH